MLVCFQVMYMYFLKADMNVKLASDRVHAGVE